MSNILITGGNGFLGSRILEELQKENNCKSISRKNNVDIKDYESFNNIDFEPEIIIHSAANLSDDLEECFLSNISGMFNICKYSKEKNVKHLILISSISIFNNIENGYFNNYGFSKKQAEDIAIRYCQENNIKLTILRCSQIYDERQNARKSQGMLYYFIDTIKEKREINIFGKKNPIRNYIFVEDVVNIIKLGHFLGLSVNEIMKMYIPEMDIEQIGEIQKAREASFLLENFDIQSLIKSKFIDSKSISNVKQRVNTFFGLSTIYDFSENRVLSFVF